MPDTLFAIVPQTITVHLGPPDSDAENITVGFVDYIKNVASRIINPTWPESAIRANIHAIVSFILNRTYEKFYRSKGYNFDITNSPNLDLPYEPDGNIFLNISNIVDEIFNDYIARQGSFEPLLTPICDGTVITCEGLYQWEALNLAQQGLNSFEILQYFFGEDIEMIENAPVEVCSAVYTEIPLRLGDTGNNVLLLQSELNQISQGYKEIPKIANVDGVFREDTEAAVKKYQEIFLLPPTGTVDKSTWYSIKRHYVDIYKLLELLKEGVKFEEKNLPFSTRLSENMSGVTVKLLQYYLTLLSYFNPDLISPPLNGVFGINTVSSVKKFQEVYGLPVTGVVDNATWNIIDKVYTQTVASLPTGYEGNSAKLYPGYFLSKGMQNENVRDLQTYLNLISDNIPEISHVPATGYFGEQTENAVKIFQQLFGLPVNGMVGPVTWYHIAKQYDILNGNSN